MLDTKPKHKHISASYHIGDLSRISAKHDCYLKSDFETIEMRIETVCGDTHTFTFFVSGDCTLPEFDLI